MRRMTEEEDKFEVDSDWVLPQLTDLVPDGRLDQETRELDNVLRYCRCGPAIIWDHAATSGGWLRDWLAVEGSQWDGSRKTPERLAG
jgi:hypothetical protein